MKRFLLILTLLACSLPGFAQYQDKDERLIERQQEYQTFDTLLSQKIVTLNTTVSINSTDITSTGTADVTLLPSESFYYPIKLRVQNHNAGSLTYTIYETDATGVTQPTATAAHLMTPQGEAVVNGKAYEGIFYSAPNISIGASGSNETVIEVWGRSR